MEVNNFVKDVVKTGRVPSIISVSGRIGSGKDEVGKIIQYLTSPEAIYKGGYSHCKDMGFSYEVNWEIKKFAGKLKQIASIITGVPVDKFEDQEFKKTNMPECWDKPQQSGRYKALKPMTYRQFLQELGTNSMRDNLHSNVWVSALFSDYNTSSRWIITDTRFQNELEAVKSIGGITIRVVRPGVKQDNHPSETNLDSAEFDYTVINDGSIDDLVVKIRRILIKERII
jgi:hypothetical protein